ncbi:Glycogen phosphorylase [Rubellimicrobium mesophilum DSM 19309]|uniref:glycogen phosphorylase n=1 Tax=Rubellimicrobium mesophilum DSM 19309 TaxID=442562 RepID=A0A017HJR9_9RHOB|nr:alpha-glucan family phosphorylase [Rubellimicrobium mesophilum]EYD74762.1 Glycogen phosphorylase [Rubellimicrobium mesophilum DSM 19309]
MPDIRPHAQRARVAYLTMEIGLRAEMHTYSGGLGILAGDIARSAADLGLPMVFVTLASREGYLRQGLDREGRQVDHTDPWEPSDWAMPLDETVKIELEGRPVHIRAWLFEVVSPLGGAVPVLLLDTDLPQNDPRDRTITGRLYGGAEPERIKQEAVLGFGADLVLRTLGFRVESYHLNEGHAAFLPLARLLRRRDEASPGAAPKDPAGQGDTASDIEAVRQACVFTTHTPVEAGHDRFDYADVERILGDLAPVDVLKPLAGPEVLNMTHLALSLSRYVNGVAKRHGEVASALYPAYRVHAITNGVHLGQWAHPALARLFDARLPGWRETPETLHHADYLDPEELRAARREAKSALLAEIKARTGQELDPTLPLFGFARRMTGYKRPDLLFSDLDRLRAIARGYPFQVVMAGKAHPKDAAGKEGIGRIAEAAQALAGEVPVVFVPGYDMALAAHLVGGSDVWLNTPVPPLEASGTSGMKAALNGGLNLSILDGWWVEGWEEGVTGWAVDAPGEDEPVGVAGQTMAQASAPLSAVPALAAEGDGFLPLEEAAQDGPETHAARLYDKLEQVVLPLWHENPEGWARMMRQAIARVAPVFNSHAMMRRYTREAYRW